MFGFRHHFMIYRLWLKTINHALSPDCHSSLPSLPSLPKSIKYNQNLTNTARETYGRPGRPWETCANPVKRGEPTGPTRARWIHARENYRHIVMKGVHLIVDFEGVRNIDALKNLEVLQDIQRGVAKECKLTVVGESGVQFKPHGATSVLVLSESHFSIHTWWEEAQAHADIFCCNDKFDARVAVMMLKTQLDAETANWCVIDRPLKNG